MKTLQKILLLSVAASTSLVASGWRIPEQSATSTALSGAYIANANGAEAAYYNPANMSFYKDTQSFEADLMFIHLTSIDYKDNQDSTKDGSSKVENFLVPTLFYTSKPYGDLRWGVSITTPGGLSKRWDSPYQERYAKEFTLEIIELNPTVSYKINEKISVAAGIRAIYSHGIVKSDAGSIARDLEGETIEFGYNLALAYKFLPQGNFSVTYRSNVDLKEEGNAKLYIEGEKRYDGGANVTVPLPAVLSVACAYTFKSDTTVEVVWDRTYWSKYKELDFNYSDEIPSVLVPYFDDPKARNWEDSDAYRIGITQHMGNYDLMLGYAYDNNPIPDGRVAFELPDSDASIYSVGARFYIDKTQKITVGYFYDRKKKRNDTNVEAGVDGEFSNAAAHFVSVGYSLDF